MLKENENVNERNAVLSKDSKELYHIGIIDFLQKWNWFKKGESCYKTQVLRRNKGKLSAVEPDKYKQRFLNFMNKNVFAQLSHRSVKDYSYLFDPVKMLRA